MQVCKVSEGPILVKLDPMGQITLPRYLRKQLGIGVDEPVRIYAEGDNICIERLPKPA